MSAITDRAKREREERFERYTALRDAGSHPTDAGREVGVSDSTWGKYERSYRELRHLPTPERRAWR